MSFSFRSLGEERQLTRADEGKSDDEKLSPGDIVITPDYTNALLVAILPYVGDFAARLNLAVPQPLTTNDVAVFGADRQVAPDRRVEGEPIVSAGIGGGLVLKNGMLFVFDRGHVIQFETPAVRDRTKVPPAQKINYNTSQAISIARQKIQALGYDLAILDADLEPEVHKAATLHGKIYPIHHIIWKRPNSDSLATEVWINGETGALEHLWLLGLPTAPPPTLTVKPAIERERNGIRDFSHAEREELCAKLLPDINNLAHKLDLPLGFPITRATVRSISAFAQTPHGSVPRVNIVLTNGYAFASEDDPHINSFSTPDAFFGHPFVRSGALVGKWNFTKRSAIKLARQFIKKAGVDKNNFCATHSPRIEKPFVVGRPVIPRYQFTWISEGYFVHVEVDAEKGRVTELSFGRADDIFDASPGRSPQTVSIRNN